MSTSKKPLKPADFPVTAEGKKIKKQDGQPVANTEDPDLAADVAERLNDDEAGAKRTSGQPDRLIVEQGADKVQQRYVFRAALTRFVKSVQAPPELTFGWCLSAGIRDATSRASAQTSPSAFVENLRLCRVNDPAAFCFPIAEGGPGP
jgi:hypothetical protein